MSTHGWVGKRLKHDDGREGVIVSEFESFGSLDLHILEDGGGRSKITLNSYGKDSGDKGWKWEFSPENHPGEWSHIGDHNPE